MTIEMIYHTQTNLLCLVLFAILLTIHNRYNKTNTMETRFLKRMILLACAYCISEMIAWLADGVNSLFALILQFIFNITYICIPAIICYVWLQYVCYKTESMEKMNSKGGKAIKAILWLVIASVVSTPVTNWGFIIDRETRCYLRNWGAYLTPVVCFFFLGMSMAWVERYMNSTKMQSKKDAALPLLYFPLPITIAGLAQILFYGLSLNTVGFCFSVILIFMNQQFEKISVDELTGLNNRRELKAYLSDLIHNQRKASVFLCMIDVDFFKSINDTYGHLEGDFALKAVADTIKKVASEQKNKLFLSRYGGDEFIVTGAEWTEGEIYMLEDQLRKEMKVTNETIQKPYTLTLSIGHSSRGIAELENIEQLLRIADERMYEVKKNRVRKEGSR